MASYTQRPQRINAGKTSKYADFSVVSFPQLQKHSIVKTSLINIDPLSPPGVQAGNIKAYGDRKKILVIKTGTRQEMEEVSSRFSKDAGSEEIFIPERECEYSLLHDTRQQTMDEDVDADEYALPTQRAKNSLQSKTTIDVLPSLPASAFDKDDEETFDRILPTPCRSSITKTAKRKREEAYSSSLAASSDSEREVSEDRWSKNKKNLIRTNIDLTSLKKQKTSKKKQRIHPVVVQQSGDDYKSLSAEVDLLKKRVSKLEKVYGVMRKNTSFDQTKRTSTSISQPALEEDTASKVKAIFGINPNSLKSPINRPTKIMRELYKNSDHELSNWKEVIEPNELLLKDFIQQKCLILDEDISHTWSSIMNSMTQMPYDAVKYKSKLNDNIAPPTTTTATTTAPSPPLLNDNEQEQQPDI